MHNYPWGHSGYRSGSGQGRSVSLIRHLYRATYGRLFRFPFANHMEDGFLVGLGDHLQLEYPSRYSVSDGGPTDHTLTCQVAASTYRQPITSQPPKVPRQVTLPVTLVCPGRFRAFGLKIVGLAGARSHSLADTRTAVRIAGSDALPVLISTTPL